MPSVRLYHELRWRRRSGWLYSLICLLVAAGLGVVVSSFMTPLVLLAVGLPLKLASRIGISPLVAAGGSAVIRDWAYYQLTNFGQVLDATQKIHSLSGLTFMLPALERLSTVSVPGPRRGHSGLVLAAGPQSSGGWRRPGRDAFCATAPTRRRD
jgi:hypothetical protein